MIPKKDEETEAQRDVETCPSSRSILAELVLKVRFFLLRSLGFESLCCSSQISSPFCGEKTEVKGRRME